MASLQLRPLGVGEIVGDAFTVCRRRFGPMFAIALVLAGVPFLVSLVGGCSLDAGGSETCTSPIGWLGYVAGSVGIVVASTAGSLVAAGAYADVPSDWRRATRVGLRRTIAIAWAAMVVGVPMGIGVLVLIFAWFFWNMLSLIVIGFVLFVVLVVLVAVSLAVAFEALIIEGIGPIECLKRSWRLVAGERWRVLGAGLLVLILGGGFLVIVWAVVWFILSSGLGVSDGVADYLGEQLAALLSAPLSAAALTVIYLDLRVRKESLSTDELAAALSEQGFIVGRTEVTSPGQSAPPTGAPGQGPQRLGKMKRATAVRLIVVVSIALIATVVWMSRPPPRTTVLVPYDTEDREIVSEAAGLTVLFCMATEQGPFSPDELMESILADLPATAAEKGWDSDDIDQVIAGMVYHAMGDCEERILRALP